MLIFRLICAILMAWAANWVMSRGESAGIVEGVPEMTMVVPLAAAAVGFVNLAKRQGWGMIVAAANGVWSGLLTLLVAIVFYLGYIGTMGIRAQTRFDFEGLVRLIGSHGGELIESMAHPPFLAVVVASSILVALITEVVHWALVRILKVRNRRADRRA